MVNAVFQNFFLFYTLMAHLNKGSNWAHLRPRWHFYCGTVLDIFSESRSYFCHCWLPTKLYTYAYINILLAYEIEIR